MDCFSALHEPFMQEKLRCDALVVFSTKETPSIVGSGGNRIRIFEYYSNKGVQILFDIRPCIIRIKIE